MNQIKENESILIYIIKDDGLSVEEIMMEKLNVSGRFLNKLKKNKSVLLNGKVAKLEQRTAKGDTIVIIMEDELEESEPQDILIEIIYEDHDLIVINKQPNIVVHPTKSHRDNTISNAISYYFKKNNINKKVRFVNRLDMNTSGVLIVAKNPFAHQQMSLQFEKDIIEKKYIALVEGVIEEDFGIIDKPIARDENTPMIKIVSHEGKDSLTEYKVLERYNEATLVELNLKTGRTHQIRVHMSYLGHPIIGDSLYNKPSDLIDRQALHSYSMTFYTPREGKRIEVKADLPEDMKRLIKSLK